MKAALVLLVACSSTPKYLGTEVPKPCTTRDAEGCLGWMMERDLLAAELGIYDNAPLRGYVQRVVERLARAANLGATPRIMIADQDETYATAGRRIIISRTTIEKLESEAELAGILAHELAHIEARHVMVTLFGRPESDSAANRRDAEAIADERAVVLLEKAGYAPSAMAAALDAVLEEDDEEHPPRLERIARVAKLGANRGGFEGRAEFLANIDRMVVGRDVRLGHRVGDVWVIPALSLAFELDEDTDRIVSHDEILVLRRERATILAYAVGSPWARELAGTFAEAGAEMQIERARIGRVTRGTMPARAAGSDDSPLGKLSHAIRSTLPQPAAGTRVAIVERRHGALVIELGGKGVPELHMRAATDAELAASQPNRIAIENARTAGRISALGICRGRLIERSDRTVNAGDPIKCATAETARDESR
ncbi:MAG: M48 family metallopeptidase [Myxococcota bacterium]|nr:M48 family metalloprotease [Deltaproteobacteria bacterium]MDQ3338877.1 M48 family metallopeptidase [Myxococcota bacterium]